MTDTIGSILRTNRELRNLSLEQVSKATHIRARFLEALENDQWEILPSNVQGKGFLRLYADFLELSSTHLLQLRDEAVSGISNSAAVPSNETAAKATRNFPPAGNEKSTQSLPAVDTHQGQPAASEELAQKGSEAIFKEIGEALRNQRLSLGLTLQEIEKHTRVRLHAIELLEAGRMNELASLVQARGMLNNYAHFLNMDAEGVLLRYADGLQMRLVENNTPLDKQKAVKKKPPKQVTEWRQLFTPDLIVGTIVIFALVIFGVWSAAQVTSFHSNTNISTISSISDILLKTQNSGSTPIPGTEVAETSTEVNTVNNNPEANPAVPAVVISGTLPVVGTNPLQVYIVPRQRVWMRVTVDKKVVFDGRTLPGNAYPYGGDESIELLSGDASALEVFFNQNNLGSLGLTGQVVSMIFTKNGMITPTPKFTVTPTNTLAPTATLLPSPTTTPTPSVTPLIP